MARKLQSTLIGLTLLTLQGSQASPQGGAPTTCAGEAGYCSEAYVGGTCIFVCAFGRPNVPVCQANGQWTDSPRCIEHEPGLEEQISGTCLGIPGYCSLDVTGGVCEFDCLTGPDIRSFCTPDGTWDPYPTCDGDIRETRDGCDPCPGPFGGSRNRTLEGNQPNQPAARPNNNNSNNRNSNNNSDRRNNNNGNNNNNRRNNNSPPQSARPANNQRTNPRNSAPAVIQPSRQTPFAPQQPARPVANQGNNRNSGGSRNNAGNGGRNQNRNNQSSRRNNNNNNNGNGGFQERPRQANFAPTSSQPSPPRNQPPSSVGQCPGNSLEACIDVCPSFSVRIFGACVSGCARRCSSKK